MHLAHFISKYLVNRYFWVQSCTAFNVGAAQGQHQRWSLAFLILEWHIRVHIHAFGVVSSIFYTVKILVHSHFDLVSLLLATEETEPVSEPVTQMALELINNHPISVQKKR